LENPDLVFCIVKVSLTIETDLVPTEALEVHVLNILVKVVIFWAVALALFPGG